MRREWINEGKPRESIGDMDTLQGSRRSIKSSEGPRNNSEIIGEGKITEDPDLRRSSAPSDDDLYVASPPRQQHTTGKHSPTKSTGIDLSPDSGDNGVPEDDLDALLAETDNQKRHFMDHYSIDQQGTTPSSKEEDFDAEMEVMAEMDEIW